MKTRHDLIRAMALGLVFIALPAAAQLQSIDTQTATPIKHLIIVIGENRSFDHIFAAYRPRPGQSVLNLLSQGIINEDGTPGPSSWCCVSR